MFIDPYPYQILGQTIDPTVGSGTLTGLSPAYVDADGEELDDWWQWQMIADLYVYSQDSGIFSTQVITYVGDGTANRLIATTANLTVGKAAVWVMGGVGAGVNSGSTIYRGTGMTGSRVIVANGYTSTVGIMGLGATGFTVSAGAFGTMNVANVTGENYTAIVISDQTTTNRYLKLGTYVGTGAGLVVSGVGTHAWIMGDSYWVFRSPEMAGDTTLRLMGGGSSVNTGFITALTGGSMTIGLDTRIQHLGRYV